mmetsp:Transcript_3015/g.7909  ORF Transcript_3015/g.7909 Transcript_3015/m.7909 type:complete len:216 (-) Transcript_3015:96-743(-)
MPRRRGCQQQQAPQHARAAVDTASRLRPSARCSTHGARRSRTRSRYPWGPTDTNATTTGRAGAGSRSGSCSSGWCSSCRCWCCCACKAPCCLMPRDVACKGWAAQHGSNGFWRAAVQQQAPHTHGCSLHPAVILHQHLLEDEAQHHRQQGLQPLCAPLTLACSQQALHARRCGHAHAAQAVPQVRPQPRQLVRQLLRCRPTQSHLPTRTHTGCSH